LNPLGLLRSLGARALQGEPPTAAQPKGRERQARSKARYEHLPICKSALDLCVHFEKPVAGFSRYHKYTLGNELRACSRAVLMQVLRANQASDAPARSTELLVLRDHIDALLLSVPSLIIVRPSRLHGSD